MTPKEKADDLMAKMDVIHYFNLHKGEKLPVSMHNDQKNGCALAAVNEIMKVFNELEEDADLMFKKELAYWELVKNELTTKIP